MSSDLLTAGEGDQTLDIIKQMRVHGVRRVPVVDESRALAGILVLDDVIELIAEGLNDLVGLVTSELRHERERRAQ